MFGLPLSGAFMAHGWPLGPMGAARRSAGCRLPHVGPRALRFDQGSPRSAGARDHPRHAHGGRPADGQVIG